MDKTVNDFLVPYYSGKKNKNIAIKDDYKKDIAEEVKSLASSALILPFKNIISTALEAIKTESLINIKEANTKYNILLLTNRDSDNVGDQVIEASDISLINTVMKNLNVSPLKYTINSRAAAIVPKEYIFTKDENLLKTAEKEISKCDMIIFGGAPMFNYLYQIFYERTAVTLELAKKYNKPVIFSAIGVERYDENNAKCQRLKETLNFDCVKQITTRDGINELTKYKTNPNMIIDRVADPAVFSAQAFKKFLTSKKNKNKKTVGIFVFRANGFKDNKIDFSKEQAAKLWKDLIEELQNKGYDYKLLTSGHFGDEAFLDYLIRKHGISEKDCIFNVNFPELLLKKISSFDAVVSCRLHPSIISYSLNVPSIGIIWNPKVKYFYDCIGYENRCIDVNNIDVKEIVEKIEISIAEGITKDPEYLFSVYRYLFSGIQHALNLNNDNINSFTYEELIHNIHPFAGTSNKEKELKLKRKFRRIYENTNKRLVIAEELKENVNKGLVIAEELKEKIKKIENEMKEFNLYYHSTAKSDKIIAIDNLDKIVLGEMKRISSGAMELKINGKVSNTGKNIFLPCVFQYEQNKFVGWRLRFRIKNQWFWYLEDDNFCLKEKYNKKKYESIKVFLSGDKIPKLPFDNIISVVMEAQWN